LVFSIVWRDFVFFVILAQHIVAGLFFQPTVAPVACGLRDGRGLMGVVVMSCGGRAKAFRRTDFDILPDRIKPQSARSAYFWPGGIVEQLTVHAGIDVESTVSPSSPPPSFLP
jgi:hypothetical protein